MGKRMGILCIILGVACLLGAVGLVVYNRRDEQAASDFSQSLLQEVRILMDQTQSNPDLPQQPPQSTVATQDMAIPSEMPTVTVNGYDCIGILSIPVIELELPILADWSYAKLKKAPCHYYGTYYQPDFVIAGHNYKAHFKKLSSLQEGDLVIFTDATGAPHCYEVVLLETLQKEATLEMIASGFDLSLYTCTPGGASRVTVRCKTKA
jgi:sortase A